MTYLAPFRIIEDAKGLLAGKDRYGLEIRGVRNLNLLSRFDAYQVVLEPDEDTPEWWAGAPSVARADDGTFYLACRMREGTSPRGRRGYEVRILRSRDGVAFEPVHAIPREAVPIPGFERPALVRDAQTGKELS